MKNAAYRKAIRSEPYARMGTHATDAARDWLHGRSHGERYELGRLALARMYCAATLAAVADWLEENGGRREWAAHVAFVRVGLLNTLDGGLPY